MSAAGPGGLGAAVGRADQALAERIGADGGRQRAGNGGNRAVEIEFADHDIAGKRIGRDRAQRGHQAKRDRQIEMRCLPWADRRARD